MAELVTWLLFETFWHCKMLCQVFMLLRLIILSRLSDRPKSACTSSPESEDQAPRLLQAARECGILFEFKMINFAVLCDNSMLFECCRNCSSHFLDEKIWVDCAFARAFHTADDMRINKESITEQIMDVCTQLVWHSMQQSCARSSVWLISEWAICQQPCPTLWPFGPLCKGSAHRRWPDKTLHPCDDRRRFHAWLHLQILQVEPEVETSHLLQELVRFQPLIEIVRLILSVLRHAILAERTLMEQAEGFLLWLNPSEIDSRAPSGHLEKQGPMLPRQVAVFE